MTGTRGATRTELLALEREHGVARAGRDLLEDKRTALVKELRATAEAMLDERFALQEIATRARRALAECEALDGPDAVRSAAFTGPPELEVSAEPDIVMGVRLPRVMPTRVERGLAARGYALVASSARIDALATAFEAEVDQTLRFAAQQARLRAIGEELRAVTRRVNALSQIVLPELLAERARVVQSLEEREREERFRLRRIKGGRRERSAS
jgi:V/A-type H+-transporting ATPase subunit D